MKLSELNDSINWLDRMIDHNDKRRHPRKKVRLKGHYCILDTNGTPTPDPRNQHHPAGVIDMSVSGAGVISPRPLQMSEKFQLICESEKGKLKLELQVVRNSRLKSMFLYGCVMSTCKVLD